jgi:hypothetical protein
MGEVQTVAETRFLNLVPTSKGAARRAETICEHLTIQMKVFMHLLQRCLPSHRRGTHGIRHQEGRGLVKWVLSGRLFEEDFMNVLAAIGREEKKVKKQLAKLQRDLIGLQSAAKALGRSANQDFTTAGKRVLSAAGRAKISKATKRRWAKLRAQARKSVS